MSRKVKLEKYTIFRHQNSRELTKRGEWQEIGCCVGMTEELGPFCVSPQILTEPSARRNLSCSISRQRKDRVAFLTAMARPKAP